MKTTKSLFLTLTLALFSTYAFAQFTSTKMNNAGTAHNFATGTGANEGGTASNYTFAASATAGDGNGQCAVCHTPHNAATAAYPLWDHDATSTAFDLYDNTVSSTIDGTVSMSNSGSSLCLGCHDGSANLDSYGKAISTGTAMAAGDAYANFGSDLTNDHPIAISYPWTANAASEQMVDPATLIADGGWLYGTGTASSGTLTVECASCHSMHNPAVTSRLLRETNDNSALCFTCHLK
ncbi:DUF1769 domain-containing protein [Aestuariivivens marinum]|uniref:DUF1769 domain-containing protein n=1 Tax=Aestuariivivens marinum TaxID=2913555 RepID=UPI001F5A7AD4|nr:DUF1769 domain-containing protein [Aestuariivivens marinum]